MLAEVRKIDPEGFFGFIQNEQDQRNVCGLTPIYTMLHMLKYAEGVTRSAQLLKYDVASDPQGAVTFASLAFH
jgi:predicted class III extradiol MEMO1 family dioxygenase